MQRPLRLVFLCALAALTSPAVIAPPLAHAQDRAPSRSLAVLRSDVEAAARAYDQDRLAALREELRKQDTGGAELELTRLHLRATFYEANILRYRRQLQEHPSASEFQDRQVTIAEVAEGRAQELVDRHPEDVGLRVLLGEFIALQITGPNGALIGPRAGNEVDRAIELAPDDPDAHLAAGRRYMYTPGAFGGSDAKGLEHLLLAEKTLNARERAQLLARRTELYARVSDAAARKAELRKIVTATRTEVWRLHEEVLIQLSVVYRRLGRDRRAKVALKRALAANPDSEAATLLLARLEDASDQ